MIKLLFRMFFVDVSIIGLKLSILIYPDRHIQDIIIVVRDIRNRINDVLDRVSSPLFTQ